MVLPQLFEAVKRAAPGIDIGVRQILPAPVRVWQSAIDDLDARALDLAVVPIDDIPARFAERLLYEEDFVVALRAAIASADDPPSRASARWSIWSFHSRPMRMASSTIIWVRAIVPEVALMDAGVRWLFDILARPPRTLATQGERPRRTIKPKGNVRDRV